MMEHSTPLIRVASAFTQLEGRLAVEYVLFLTFAFLLTIDIAQQD